ncbi:MAG: hypothetical protein CM15mV38_1110 [uncultured marine virus]|nr:MAG: hypothetical protein CM15mV38_1110 [uncultured marine virus]
MSVILRGTEPTDIDVTQASHQNKSYSITTIVIIRAVVSISVTQQ